MTNEESYGLIPTEYNLSSQNNRITGESTVLSSILYYLQNTRAAGTKILANNKTNHYVTGPNSISAHKMANLANGEIILEEKRTYTISSSPFTHNSFI